MANYITNKVDGNSTSLIEAVKKNIGTSPGSDEEKKEHKLEMEKAQMQYDLDIMRVGGQAEEGDRLVRADDSKHDLDNQESDNQGWLEKNIHPVLSISIVFLTFCIYAFILSGGNGNGIMSNQSGMKDIVIYILGALTTVATQVVSYYFGSSSSSAVKNKALTKALINK
jgi:hypothetical protein